MDHWQYRRVCGMRKMKVCAWELTAGHKLFKHLNNNSAGNNCYRGKIISRSRNTPRLPDLVSQDLDYSQLSNIMVYTLTGHFLDTASTSLLQNCLIIFMPGAGNIAHWQLDRIAYRWSAYSDLTSLVGWDLINMEVIWVQWNCCHI